MLTLTICFTTSKLLSLLVSNGEETLSIPQRGSLRLLSGNGLRLDLHMRRGLLDEARHRPEGHPPTQVLLTHDLAERAARGELLLNRISQSGHGWKGH